MKKIPTKLSSIFFTLLGLIFGILVFSTSTPVFAVPDNTNNNVPEATTDADNVNENTTENSNDTTSENNNTENSENCYTQVKEMSWIVCPATKVVAGAIDSIYGLISDFLVVKPISTDSTSPIYIVWEYARNITNIIFIIFILIIIYSQVTGFGINNYGIKKTLPRIIIAAILVNLSYLICSVAVDFSNIIGSSLVSFFQNIADTAISGQAEGSADLTSISWSEITTTILSGGVITFVATTITATFAGGFKALLWILIPVVLSGVIAVAVGLIMVSLRQALVIILVMISPLAFVAYLLPNTNGLFKKWKDLFETMLVFYPIFSTLFGASYLAGWVIIGSAENFIWVIIGMAVQVIPLILAVPLMKTSGTFLDRAGNILSNYGNKFKSNTDGYFNQRKALARAEHTARAAKKPLSVKDAFTQKRLPSLSGYITYSSAKRKSMEQKLAEDTQNMVNQRLDARSMNKRVIGFDKKTGKAIYSKQPLKSNRYMEVNYANRVHSSNARNVKQESENVMSTMGTFLKENGIDNQKLSTLAAQQADNYLESETLQRAAHRNDLSDKRFYFQTIQKAAERNENGELKNPEAYQRFIEAGAGADFFIDENLKGAKRAEALKIRRDATTSVVADAYEMIENERKINTAKYTTYLDKQVSKEVDKIYDEMLVNKNIDGIVAAQNITAKRGDYDKIAKKLSEYMDKEGYVELNTDFANTLALNLLSMKNASPDLGRLGKHINVETWRYTNGDRDSSYVTMKEFFTGRDSEGAKTKFNAQVLLQGTSLKEIDRTFYSGLSSNIDRYFTPANYGSISEATEARELLFRNMIPSLISAVGTFSSGSEQIINTMNFITGAKYDSKTDKWSVDTSKLSPEQLQEFSNRTNKYLNALTTENVIGMKTDTFNAVISQLTHKHFGDRDAAIEEFRQIFSDKGILKDLDEIKVQNPSAISGMRSGVRKALGV